MRAGNVWDALRDGNPGVITAVALMFLMVVAGIWLCFARRPIPPKKGRPTVDAIRTRLIHETQAEIEHALCAEFEQRAMWEAATRAAEAADAVTEVIAVTAIPEPRTPRLLRPYAQLQQHRETERT